jgi:site-specific DNA recombinase
VVVTVPSIGDSVNERTRPEELMRVAVYARYSSENQKEASIGDQVEVCRRFIQKQGWTLAQVYSDAAMSGASRFRPGYQKLLADAERRLFDVVVCEALDRLGRKLADIADLFDRLNFHGVKLHTIATGEVTALHIGMLGTMAQLYLSDLREKVWRGQLGRVRQGRIAGGKAYGYDVVTQTDGRAGETGLRRINENEAAIVQRIFRDFAAGASPRAIAKRLNADGVPGPEGRQWRDTTIRGQFDRGTGLLNNTVYVGRIEWNRTAYVKDPRTGKRVARIKGKDEREIVEVPALRIIDDELWRRVKDRQAALQFEIGRDARGNALNRAHRRKFLLSELLVCGECGGGYTIVAKDRYGCASRRAKGTCSNSQTITRQVIEARVLGGLKDKLFAPELVAEFVRSFQEEMNATRRTASQRRDELRRELEGVERKMAGVVKAIEDGMYSPTLKERMRGLETRKAELAAALGAQPETSPIELHPNLAELYRRKVGELEIALNDESIKAEASELLRSLIDKVELTPEAEAPNGLKAELHGDLASILSLCESGARKQKLSGAGASESQLSVVAGVGFEPTTFRL